MIESGWEDAPLAGLQADAACSFEVIEHLFDPGAYLRAVRLALKPGGVLVLTCPNIRGFDFQVLGFDVADNFGLGHINMFHPAAMTRLLERCGYTVRAISTPGRLDADRAPEDPLGRLRCERPAVPSPRPGRGMGPSGRPVPGLPARERTFLQHDGDGDHMNHDNNMNQHQTLNNAVCIVQARMGPGACPAR